MGEDINIIIDNYLLTLIDAGNILEIRQNGGSIKLFKNRKSGKNVLRNQIDEDYQEYLDESNELEPELSSLYFQCAAKPFSAISSIRRVLI